MLKFDHYTVAVHDLDQAIKEHETRFGMEKVGERSLNKIGNFNFQPMGFNGQQIMHLISPASEEGPVAKLMKDRATPFNPHGEGLYLLAWHTDDVAGFTANAEAGGARVNRVPNMPGNAWIHPTSANFVFHEIIQPS